MTLEDFRKFIDEQHLILQSLKSTANHSDRERVFARVIKLGEEYGELCDQVLASMGDQRKDKLTQNDGHSLSDEFADVVIVTFLLAKSMNVDIMRSLDHKIEKIREKHNKQLLTH